MHRHFSFLGAAALLSAAALFSQEKANDVSLKVGLDAPALEVSRWVKGEGPSKLEQGKVYVVEFWATWCGPCKQTIPHLTEMAHAYKGKVTFIGVSIAEMEDTRIADPEARAKAVESKVDAFVKEMGDKMDYLVARDTKDGAMADGWMKAAGQNGIPAAFIVDGSGKIAWIGHPTDSLEKAIETALAGN